MDGKCIGHRCHRAPFCNKQMKFFWYESWKYICIDLRPLKTCVTSLKDSISNQKWNDPSMTSGDCLDHPIKAWKVVDILVNHLLKRNSFYCFSNVSTLRCLFVTARLLIGTWGDIPLCWSIWTVFLHKCPLRLLIGPCFYRNTHRD